MVNRLSSEYSSNTYDGTRQKVQRILSSMQEDPNGDECAPKPFPSHFDENATDITNIIKKVWLKVETHYNASHAGPHEEDEAWESLYDGIKFYHDMNE